MQKTGDSHMWLDITHKGKEFLQKISDDLPDLPGIWDRHFQRLYSDRPGGSTTVWAASKPVYTAIRASKDFMRAGIRLQRHPWREPAGVELPVGRLGFWP